jgi:hypothetical protein
LYPHGAASADALFWFPSTNSFISAKLNRSKFCMVTFIYPQHAPDGRRLGRPRVQADLVLDDSSVTHAFIRMP